VLASVVVLTAGLFALAGFTNGMLAKSFVDGSIVPTFVLSPLTYLGGIFYSVQRRPAFWQAVPHANPILYMINAFRYGFLGISDIGLGWSYLLIFAFIAALTAINLALLARGHGIRT